MVSKMQPNMSMCSLTVGGVSTGQCFFLEGKVISGISEEKLLACFSETIDKLKRDPTLVSIRQRPGRPFHVIQNSSHNFLNIIKLAAFLISSL